ncbi:unnamed protein product [Arctogadus glacialis]
MATKSQKKASKAAIQSLASPALRQTLMADANVSATAAATRPSTPPAEQPMESALLELIKAEMGISRQQLGDKIKKEMASLHAEIKEDIAALRQDTKADIASLKTEFRAEMSSLRSAQTETATTIRDIEGTLNRHDSSIAGLDKTILDLKQEVGKLKDRNDDLENRSRRQNLRIIGIPEGVENGKPTAFMASFFACVLGDEVTDPLVLDLIDPWLLNPNPATVPDP